MSKNNQEEKVKNIKEKEYHLEDAESIRNYCRWLRQQPKPHRYKGEFAFEPLFSIVIPVYNTVDPQLQGCIESVLDQTYKKYELILVDDHSSWSNVRPMLQRYETNPKVKVIYRESNGHIAAATNDGIESSSGDYIAFMDCDDLLDPGALYEVAKLINENPDLDFIYSDEDKVTEDGKIFHMPFFKPGWSPDLFMCMNYTNHFSVYRASLVKETGGLRSEYNGSQDYDFVLRFMERSDNTRVGHIPKILYHWREREESVAFDSSAKNYAVENAIKAKEDYLRRNNLSGRVEFIEEISLSRVVYDVQGDPLVSIIIPSKDNPDLLRQCLTAIKKYTKYKKYEIVVVDNGSNARNKEAIEELATEYGIAYVYEPMEFNFSRMCNIGAKTSRGDYFLFLNDDIEVYQDEWLERMLGQAQREHVGAVGAKLYYPGSMIMQHDGVVNITEGPSHIFGMGDDEKLYYFCLNRVDMDCIGVTGACLLVQKEKFWAVEGYDESFPIAYNDVELCFSLCEKGFYNVLRNDVTAYHHESFSRGNDHIDEGKLFRLSKDRINLFIRFPDLYKTDPFLNKNIHYYKDVLNIKNLYDRLQLMDVTGAIPQGEVNIDKIVVQEKAEIHGWSTIGEEEDKTVKQRYLIFEDAYGTTYGADVVQERRTDVIEDKGEKYESAGFECILNKKELRTDIMSYRLGLLTIDESGNKYLSWSDKTTPFFRELRCRPQICDHRIRKNLKLHIGREDMLKWWLDECTEHEDYYHIRGFAFVNNQNHYQYTRSVILYAAGAESLEYEVQREERIDVAIEFLERQFLYYTGFNCYILKDSLKPGVEYEIVIRLKNQFVRKDIVDIKTGRGLNDNAGS